MNSSSHVLRCILAIFGVSLAFGSLALGQQKEAFAKAQKENRAALEKYTWKSRTELEMKGESKSVKLEQVRYDIDGKQQKTVISEPPAEQKASGRGSRRKQRVKTRIIENKKEEFAELMKSLVQLVGSYVHMPPDELQAFTTNASVSQVELEGEGLVLIKGSNARVTDDTMSIWIEPTSYGMRRIEIHTSFENKPVSFTGEFLDLTDGPTYPARLTLQYPAKEVELTVESYDYQLLGM